MIFKIKIIKIERNSGRYNNELFINGPRSSYKKGALEFKFYDYNPLYKDYAFIIRKGNFPIGRVKEKVIENNIRDGGWILIKDIKNYEIKNI